MYVLSSIYETFPISVLEACACGAPMIVTDGCQIADLVRDNVGLAVPYDEDALGKAILALLNDDGMRREFAERGKLLVREKFDWEKIVKQMECVYLDCLSPKR